MGAKLGAQITEKLVVGSSSENISDEFHDHGSSYAHNIGVGQRKYAVQGYIDFSEGNANGITHVPSSESPVIIGI